MRVPFETIRAGSFGDFPVLALVSTGEGRIDWWVCSRSDGRYRKHLESPRSARAFCAAYPHSSVARIRAAQNAPPALALSVLQDCVTRAMKRAHV